MIEQILIKELIKDRQVGAIVSASKHLIKDLIDKIDFENAKVFVEYGPGKGAITQQLLNQMRDNATLFVFETNKQFVKELIKIEDDRLIIVENDAENAKMILQNRYKIELVDYIISTIPFTFLKYRKRRRIIFRSYSILKEKGKFITYQYSWLIYYLIKERFAATTITTTLLNIPPAFIIEGVK